MSCENSAVNNPCRQTELSFFFPSRYQSFRRTLRGRGSRHSRVPLPVDINRESRTAGDSSTSGSPETGATSSSPSSTAASSSQAPSTPSTPSSSRTPSTSSGSTPSSSSLASMSRAASLSHSPAVKFLRRSDFIDFLKSKGVCVSILYVLCYVNTVSVLDCHHNSWFASPPCWCTKQEK